MSNSKTYLALKNSEAVVFQAAAGIYAAYIASGRVPDGEGHVWMERSIREALRMAMATDAAIISDNEIEIDG
ncbi:MAG: hypothetical protein ACYTGL_24420 [Planctomycetota bacterium]|jgi:hypothetical protein